MAEAAAKEPSMEEILSSIRKIIAEEGATEGAGKDPSQMKVEPEPPIPDIAMEDDSTSTRMEVAVEEEANSESAVEETVSVVQEADTVQAPSENPSGSQAAKTARSLAAIAEDIKSDNGPVTVANSLANIAASIEPAAATPEVSDTSERDAEPQKLNVEVSVAEVSETSETRAEAVEDVVESVSPVETEEEAQFKGALMSPSVDNAVTDSLDRLKRSALDDLDAKTEAILRPMLREWLDENLPALVEKLVRKEIERVARGI